jgi:hypothetical protein
MMFRSASGKQRRVVVTPLYGWNVDAMWLTPHFLVLAITSERESALPQLVRIACWELDSGRWYTSLTRQGWMHRPGFDLPALLPDWRTARVQESGSAVVLRGSKRALAFWPRRAAWSLVDARSGRAIPPKTRLANRRLLTDADTWIKPEAKREIRDGFARAFDKANRDVAEFSVLELVKGPCAADPKAYAVIARALGRDRMPGGPDMDWTRELFGVFTLDSSLTRVTRSLAPFPSGRWLDYRAYFDLEAPEDSIVVWGEGDTYADDSRRHSYPCGP